MLDGTAQLQQEAVGALGVNLIHGALTCGGDPNRVIEGLLDDLTRGRITVRPSSLSLGPLYPASIHTARSDACTLQACLLALYGLDVECTNVCPANTSTSCSDAIFATML